MKLVAMPSSHESAAQNLEAFAERVRCGHVKRYAIVSLESSESDASVQDFYVQQYRCLTNVVEELAFIASLDMLKDSFRTDLTCDQDDG